MLKKSIWFILYMAGVTALAVSLLISMLFFKEFDFSVDFFTSSSNYEYSDQLLNDLSGQAAGVWSYFDYANGIFSEESVGTEQEFQEYNLLENLYSMGYTDEEIYNALILEITDEQIYQLAEILGIEPEILQKLLWEQKDGMVSSIENSQRDHDIADVDSTGEVYSSLKRSVANDIYPVVNSYHYESTNLRYTIEKDGVIIDTNIPESQEETYDSHTYVEDREDGLTLRLFLDTDYPVYDAFWSRSLSYNQFQAYKWIMLSIMVGSALIVIISIVALSFCTGKKKKTDQVELSWIDIPPFEIAIIFWAAVATGLVVAMLTLASVCYENQTMLSLLLFTGCVLLASSLSMTGYLSLVRRIKSHTLWKNSICYKVGSAIGRFFSKLIRIPTVSQRVLVLSCAYTVIVLLLAIIGGRWALLLMTIISIGVFFFLYKDAISRQRILEAAERITSGELDYQIDLSEINHLQMDVAQSINQVGNGIQMAVQQSIKDERLRTDLITNVSHDIKTPLTSIINYVDLLKREDIQNEKAQGYLEILEQKSQRLKQLTEDLVEASKLSSGNVVLNLEQMDFNEILQQALGEFEEKFQERYLQVVLKRPEGHVYVLAEGRRMWRILENLFQNVYKYAMPATRVYAVLEKKQDYMLFALKNISEYSLNVDADDLTERFIRGDVARSTEGSGLGLSIAKNLTTLQNGEFRIHLDGDLFKVTLKFDLIVENQ